jgi:hypothetical protein
LLRARVDEKLFAFNYELSSNLTKPAADARNMVTLRKDSTYRLVTIAVFVSLSLACCDRNQSQTAEQSTVTPTPDGHSQTKALRGASAVGYDGKQLQKQVDKVLEQKEKRDRDLENELNDTSP